MLGVDQARHVVDPGVEGEGGCRLGPSRGRGDELDEAAWVAGEPFDVVVAGHHVDREAGRSEFAERGEEGGWPGAMRVQLGDRRPPRSGRADRGLAGAWRSTWRKSKTSPRRTSRQRRPSSVARAEMGEEAGEGVVVEEVLVAVEGTDARVVAGREVEVAEDDQVAVGGHRSLE